MRRQAIMVLALGLPGLAAAGCTSSTEAGSTLSALAPEPSSPAAVAAQAGGDRAQTASLPDGTRVAFAAVMGAPEAAIEPLSRELVARARLRNIDVAPAGNIGDGYLLKGYFSTMDDGGAGSVVYVWDVSDSAGKRLYRIQGQEKLAAGGSWTSVSDATMQAIADKTIDQLATWLLQAGG